MDTISVSLTIIFCYTWLDYHLKQDTICRILHTYRTS